MNKPLVVLSCVLPLIACSSSKKNNLEVLQDDLQQSSIQMNDIKIRLGQKAESNTPQKGPARPLATFSFMFTEDGHLSGSCLWTDDPHAENQQYWSIVPSGFMNGKTQFTEDEIYPVRVTLTHLVDNCNPINQTENANYAYGVDQSRDLSNSIALEFDQITQVTAHRYIIDLNKNSKPEQLYVCYNMESLEVFFLEKSVENPYIEHVHVQLSYQIDDELDPEISCGPAFYQKSGIITQEDRRTGDFIYSIR